MKMLNLNTIPIQLEKKEITQKEAINLLSSFLSKNYPVFGLQRYDEDFREEIILSIIEKGEKLLNHYNPSQGDFFNYFYCYINSLVRTKIRSMAKKNILEEIAFTEQAKNLEEKQYNYDNINYKYFNNPKIPYSKSEIKSEDLRKGFQNISKDKGILIIALKSSFYITDSQFDLICNHYNLDKELFAKTIEYCRNTLVRKSEKKVMFQERRNNAYYKHKKFQKQINKIKQSEHPEDNIIIKNLLVKKDEKYYRNWENLNNKLKNGLMILRPTNKTIADILGICERQVIYYLKCVRKKSDEITNNFDIKAE